jgi:hypothetical protein
MLAHAGTGGQGLLQPVEANFFDFDPTIAHGLEAALLECLAKAVAVEQGKAAVPWAWGEQRDEKAHGEVPCGGLLRRVPASRDAQVYGR